MDPQAKDVDPYIEFAKAKGMEIRYIVDTHIQADHLSGALEIYPAHFSGSVCGAGLSGKASSTLAFEKRWNPALTLDRAAFIEKMTSGMPPKPADIDIFLHANRTGRSR